MKAIRVHAFGGPGVLKLEEVPQMSPGPNEALIQVKAVGVNPVETYIRAGTYARKPPLPFTPGQNCNVQKCDCPESIQILYIVYPINS